MSSEELPRQPSGRASPAGTPGTVSGRENKNYDRPTAAQGESAVRFGVASFTSLGKTDKGQAGGASHSQC